MISQRAPKRPLNSYTSEKQWLVTKLVYWDTSDDRAAVQPAIIRLGRHDK